MHLNQDTTVDHILWREWQQELDSCCLLVEELWRLVLLDMLDDLTDVNFGERMYLDDSVEVEHVVGSED